LPETIQIPEESNVSQDIVKDVFGHIENPRDVAKTVILTPKNDTALKLNDQVLKHMVSGVVKCYVSADKAICDNEEEANNYPVEFLNSLTPSGMPPHRLLLKPGAIIMLLRNLDISRGLCNGTRLIVRVLHQHVLDTEILMGAHQGDRVLIPRIKLAPSDVNLPFTLHRTQYPIRLSYAMTINKAQGQTFNKLGIFLPETVFSHGQLYVAFSRARSFQNVYVQLGQTHNQGIIMNRHLTKNVVFKEVL
jgi:hypothetical protein